MECTLYKWQPTWGLPSLDPACIQVEAYLRIAGVRLSVQECNNVRTSPSGEVPAMECNHVLVGTPKDADSFGAARALIAHLKANGQDIDAGLPDEHRAELLAFTALCQTQLEPATLFTTWCETESFNKYTQKAYGDGLPFPLSRALPWTQRRKVARKFANSSGPEVYDAVILVYAALDKYLSSAARKRSSYFLGESLSSLDALLFGHLVYHSRAPVAAPELRHALESHPRLLQYTDKIAEQLFANPLPAAPPFLSQEWRERAEAAATSSSASAYRRQDPEREAKAALNEALSRRGRIWLVCAGAAIMAYVLFSGQVLDFSFSMDEDLDESGEQFEDE
eukprot:jgi/Botrbrau1/12635/Bobra.67_1s0001.1